MLDHPLTKRLEQDNKTLMAPVGAAFRETSERVNLCRNTLHLELLTNSLSICIEFIILRGQNSGVRMQNGACTGSAHPHWWALDKSLEGAKAQSMHALG